jgi:hypothetical protein
MASTCDDGAEACLALFLLLKLAIGIPLYRFIYGNERQPCGLWLLLSKWKKMTWGLIQGRLTLA